LKMSGIGGFGGSKGAIRRYISRRVVSNLKPCGSIYRHGVITGFRNTRCVKRASKCASIAGGVGRKSNPRFSCGKPQAPQLGEKELALILLQKHFRKDNLLVVLTAKKETLVGDGVYRKGFEPITHYFKGSPAYEGFGGYPTLSKSVKKSIDLWNGFRYAAPITKGGNPLVHVVSTVSIPEAQALFENGFGIFEKVGNNLIILFGTTAGTMCIIKNSAGSVAKSGACAAALLFCGPCAARVCAGGVPIQAGACGVTTNWE